MRRPTPLPVHLAKRCTGRQNRMIGLPTGHQLAEYSLYQTIVTTLSSSGYGSNGICTDDVFCLPYTIGVTKSFTGADESVSQVQCLTGRTAEHHRPIGRCL